MGRLLALITTLFVNSSFALTYTGYVYDIDQTPKEGVLVSVANTQHFSTTNREGKWEITFTSSSGGVISAKRAPSYGKSMKLHDGRLLAQLEGFDAKGKRILPVGLIQDRSSFAQRAAEHKDEIEYTWKGKVFLRDSASSNQIMIAKFDTSLNPNARYHWEYDSVNHYAFGAVKIGSQVWMSENWNIRTDSSWCYDGLEDNCTRFGRLYSWTKAQSVCPQGWRLPSLADWEKLTTTVGYDSAGYYLKSPYGWVDSGYAGKPDLRYRQNGRDVYGMNIKPAGVRYHGKFLYIGEIIDFWTSTESFDGELGIVYNFEYTINKGTEIEVEKTGAYSVRCIKK